MTDAARRASVAVTAARTGAKTALETFRADPAVDTKTTKNDLVSTADLAAQETVTEVIRSHFPDDPVVGEEGDARKDVPESGPAWVIDPIDGTANFVRGVRIWATVVTAVRDGDPLGAATVLPAMEDAYTAGQGQTTRNDQPVTVSTRSDPETFAVAVLGWGGTDVDHRAGYIDLSQAVIERFGDMRRLGSMQAALAFVASGELDAAITSRQPTPWDSIAGAHLIEQAGGTVTDTEGQRWRYDSGQLVASNGEAHETVLEAARSIR